MSAAASPTPTLTRAPVLRRRDVGLTPAERVAAELMLSGPERKRLAGLPGRGVESFLAGRLLLRELAGELLGIDPALVPLEASCIECGVHHGRPVIVDSSLHISLSHTVDDVVAAAAWHASVGVDIENRSGSAERLDAIEALAGIRSLRHWTRVEAVLKADGRGLRVDPRRVRVTEDGSQIEAQVDDSPMRYRLLDLAVGDAIGSLAIEL